MQKTEDARRSLRRLFERQQIADLGEILGVLETTTVMTAFRRLAELGYLSSYSHRGRYYTLESIAQFDADGLWLCGGVGFSRSGTLKDTVPGLVDGSEAGLFQRDLQARLQVRVHDTLLDLVKAGRLARVIFADGYVYVSSNPARSGVQIARRRQGGPAVVAVGLPSPSLIIEILLDVINAARLRGDPVAVVARLTARGVAVTLEQVMNVFRHHGLTEKKTRFRPKR